MQLSFAALVLSLTAAVSAAPNQLLARNEEATCGNKVYKADEVAAAMKAACKHIAGTLYRFVDRAQTLTKICLKDGTNAGSSSYPHKYNNFEGFEFKGLDGPFEEFPMISGKVYTGGKWISIEKLMFI